MSYSKLLESNKILNISILAYIILKPFYFFDRGLPQIADFIIIIAIIYYLLKNNFLQELKKENHKYLISFFVLVCVINGFYFIKYYDTAAMSFLIPSIYFGFNMLLFFLCFHVFNTYTRTHFTWLLYACLVSLLIQFVLFVIGLDKELPNNNFYGRRYFYFNNPNQLAYYCILIVSVVLLIEQKIRSHTFLIAIVISLSTIFIFFSTTRPAIIGMFMFLGYYIFNVLRKREFRNILFFLIPLLISFVLQSENYNYEIKRNFQRFARVEKSPVNEFHNRGYEKMFKNSQYLLFGAGEGNLDRFVTAENPRKLEIHNTIGNLAFCYGISGLLLFLLFLYHNLKRLPFKLLLLFVPVIIYNMFHNGIRFSLLWILFAVAIAISQNKKTESV